MINKYQLLSPKSVKTFRKKNLIKREIGQINEEFDPKRFAIHNLVNPEINPLNIRLNHHQMRYTQEKNTQNTENSSKI